MKVGPIQFTCLDESNAESKLMVQSFGVLAFWLFVAEVKSTLLALNTAFDLSLYL